MHTTEQDICHIVPEWPSAPSATAPAARLDGGSGSGPASSESESSSCGSCGSRVVSGMVSLVDLSAAAGSSRVLRGSANGLPLYQTPCCGASVGTALGGRGAGGWACGGSPVGAAGVGADPSAATLGTAGALDAGAWGAGAWGAGWVVRRCGRAPAVKMDGPRWVAGVYVEKDMWGGSLPSLNASVACRPGALSAGPQCAHCRLRLGSYFAAGCHVRSEL